jgi:hypothetical protein
MQRRRWRSNTQSHSALLPRIRGRLRSAAERRLLSLGGDSLNVDEAIGTIVKRLLDGVSTAPTDLNAVLQKLKIRSCSAEPLPVAGQLRRVGKEFEIVYSSFQSHERKRFTIAHELGHAIMESTGRNCPRRGREVEALCDAIAVELLMPRFVFARKVGQNISLHQLLLLKQEFETSLSATARRCNDFVSHWVFEVRNNRIAWGTHPRVSHGSLKRLDYSLQKVVLAAIGTASGNDKVCFDTEPSRWWDVEWLQLRHQERMLFRLSTPSMEPRFSDAAFEKLKAVKAAVSRSAERGMDLRPSKHDR